MTSPAGSDQLARNHELHRVNLEIASRPTEKKPTAITQIVRSSSTYGDDRKRKRALTTQENMRRFRGNLRDSELRHIGRLMRGSQLGQATFWDAAAIGR